MSFEAILQSIVDDCGGGWSAALMGLDGIAISQVCAANGPDPADPLEGDVARAGIEFGRALADMTKASESIGTGDLRESVISLDRLTLVIHSVDDPFLPSTAVPHAAVAGNPFLCAAFTRAGGHVGFVQGSSPLSARFWAEREAARFLASELGG